MASSNLEYTHSILYQKIKLDVLSSALMFEECFEIMPTISGYLIKSPFKFDNKGILCHDTNALLFCSFNSI